MSAQGQFGSGAAVPGGDASLTVLYGGVGPEREISLLSGRSVVKALEQAGEVEIRPLEINEASLPKGLDKARTIIFPVLHGEFGEDGRIQELLESEGFEFVGSEAAASRLAMDKPASKRAVGGADVLVAPGVDFDAGSPPETDEILAVLGTELILKPADSGSSVGLSVLCGRGEVEAALNGLTQGRWMLEQRILGREFSVGVLENKALGVVEIIPRKGVYDYQSKYTAGETEYQFPAQLNEAMTKRVRFLAEICFRTLGCRDFARIDFMFDSRDETFYFLEVNTLPGLTSNSLLPRSAACSGLDFIALSKGLVAPARRRFQSRFSA